MELICIAFDDDDDDFRVLRSGGLFVFVEPDNDGNIEDLLLKVTSIFLLLNFQQDLMKEVFQSSSSGVSEDDQAQQLQRRNSRG